MQAKEGDRVRIHYTLMFDNEEVIESSVGSVPLEFTIGEGKMIPGLENGVIGMRPGETKRIFVPSEEAYGPYDENMVFEFSRDRAPEGFEPYIGQRVQMYRPDGKPFIVTVIDITEDTFKMDANHPLAGKDLIFDLELLEIVS